MSILPSLPTNFESKHQILVQETEKKRQEIERLKEVEKRLTDIGVKISQRAAEALSAGQHSTEPLEQFDQLITIAQKVQNGLDRQVTNQYMDGLNTAVGATLAQAFLLEEEVQKIDGTIEQMRQLVEERRKTLALAKKVAEEINK